MRILLRIFSKIPLDRSHLTYYERKVIFPKLYYREIRTMRGPPVFYFILFTGRAEARLASKKRDPVLSSVNFIRQYFQSFASDPIMNHEIIQVNGDATENES